MFYCDSLRSVEDLKEKLLTAHSSLQKELLCKLMGLSPSISHDAFEEAVYERIGKDDFEMDNLRW